MPFSRPSLSTLRTQTRDRIRARLAEAGYTVDAALPRGIATVLAEVFAAGLHVLYGALAWYAEQILPDTAAEEWVLRHAAIYKMTRTAAVAWDGTATFTGTPATVIASGTIVTRADGAVYRTTAEGTIGGGGSIAIALEADEAGADGNVEVAQVLTLGSAIAGVDPEVTIASTITTGVDEETVEELRQRLLDRIAEEPQGGAAADYERWAREVAGVTRVLCVPVPRGGGSVDVYFLHEEGTGVVGIPTSPQIAEVDAYIQARRPVTATDVQVKAPSTTAVNYTFTALSPSSTDDKDAIEAELEAMFALKALTGDAIEVSDHWQAAFQDGRTGAISSPSSTLTPSEGQVFILGSITWP